MCVFSRTFTQPCAMFTMGEGIRRRRTPTRTNRPPQSETRRNTRRSVRTQHSQRHRSRELSAEAARRSAGRRRRASGGTARGARPHLMGLPQRAPGADAQHTPNAQPRKPPRHNSGSTGNRSKTTPCSRRPLRRRRRPQNRHVSSTVALGGSRRTPSAPQKAMQAQCGGTPRPALRTRPQPSALFLARARHAPAADPPRSGA